METITLESEIKKGQPKTPAPGEEITRVAELNLQVITKMKGVEGGVEIEPHAEFKARGDVTASELTLCITGLIRTFEQLDAPKEVVTEFKRQLVYRLMS